MIRLLLSAFNSFSSDKCRRSDAGKEKEWDRNHFNFSCGMNCLTLLAIVWVLHKMILYHSLSQGPHELFLPGNYLGRLFMFSFPSPQLYYSVCLLGILLFFFRFFKSENILLRLISLFLLLWISLFEWSFRQESSTNQTFLFCFIFSLFIPQRPPVSTGDKKNISKMISWFYTGILCTYTLAGMWKWLSLIYKVMSPGNQEIHWLHPHAALITSMIGYFEVDADYKHLLAFFKYPLIWQAGFIIVLLLQTFAIIAAWRVRLQFWASIGLIVFHLINTYFFNITFILAPIVIACLFFPYAILLKNNFREGIKLKCFSGRREEALYERWYVDGSKDSFRGFYAIREKLYDEHPLLTGILYLPGLATVTEFLWKISGKKALRPI
jgi:hypothetical protein